ncbi:unnamed protein product [Alopecurus aequalis]
MEARKDSSGARPPRGGGGKDRLSNLPVDVLGSILSFLPIKEAARAAALCRTWRHAFAGVDAISFVQHEAHDDYSHTFIKQSEEKRGRNGWFIDEVNAALLCRRRCGSHTAPRFFRVGFGCYHWWDEPMLNRWLFYVLNQSAQELHLDLRLHHVKVRDHPSVHGQEVYGESDDADVDKCPVYTPYDAQVYTIPARLFSCVAIRTLCLGACSLETPEVIHLPLLETLLLSTIRSTGNNIQRLISGCPRLVDLTLERCGYTDAHYRNPLLDPNFTITILDKHLRRLALPCCHDLVRVSVDASELKVLEYRGGVPPELFLNLHGPHKIASCTISFCGKKVYKEDLLPFRNFLERWSMGTRHLHLDSTRLGSDIESQFFMGFPWFPSLVRLELTGHLGGHNIDAVARILQQAPSVETLSLFMKPKYERGCPNVGRLERAHG